MHGRKIRGVIVGLITLDGYMNELNKLNCAEGMIREVCDSIFKVIALTVRVLGVREYSSLTKFQTSRPSFAGRMHTLPQRRHIYPKQTMLNPNMLSDFTCCEW